MIRRLETITITIVGVHSSSAMFEHCISQLLSPGNTVQFMALVLPFSVSSKIFDKISGEKPLLVEVTVGAIKVSVPYRTSTIVGTYSDRTVDVLQMYTIGLSLPILFATHT